MGCGGEDNGNDPSADAGRPGNGSCDGPVNGTGDGPANPGNGTRPNPDDSSAGASTEPAGDTSGEAPDTTEDDVGPGANTSDGTTDSPVGSSVGPQTEPEDCVEGPSNPTQPLPLPKTSCLTAEGGGSAEVSAPTLKTTLFNRWHEAWLASPAVADLDADGTNEIIVPRDDVVLIWNPDGELLHEFEMPGRVWAPPVVGDLRRDIPGLEVAVAARGQVFMWTADGETAPGFPVEWRDELRALAAADIDGEGDPELVMVTTSDLDANGQTDILYAIHSDGSVVNGFPPNTTGASGCDDACYVHAGFDQTLALGELDGDGIADILAPQDNAYVSLHAGNGRAFDAANIFEDRSKFSGIRFLLDYSQAQQGWAEDESSADQAHFTNTAPAIADVLGDGTNRLIMLSSVQNVSQDDRERGVALWVLNPDGTRPAGWVEPFRAPDFLDGLWDSGDNVVGATNQVTVLELDPDEPGLEMVFAGFDGKIHVVSAANEQLWEFSFTTEAGVLTGGVVSADLSGDGRPELIFNTYSTRANAGELIILGANGSQLHRVGLPDRGAMPAPTVADVDSDGELEIVVSLKDAVDGERQVLIYTVPGSASNCLPWPTGRANLLRNGYVEVE
jgi:hypothetical protein